MARTIDEAAHAQRRDEFLDIAERLLQTTGYQQLSIQDVLAAAGASKGAFYHYFSSKQALLEAVVERLADRTAGALAPIADEPGGPALDKLNRFFAALAGWKAQRRELLVALLQVWRSDDNAVVRQKLRPGIADRIAPLLGRIIAQGVAEGVLAAGHPDEFGRVVVSLVQDLNDRVADLLIAVGDPGEIERAVAAYTAALERVLGAPTGSLLLVDPTVLRPWFEPDDVEGRPL